MRVDTCILQAPGFGRLPRIAPVTFRLVDRAVARRYLPLPLDPAGMFRRRVDLGVRALTAQAVANFGTLRSSFSLAGREEDPGSVHERRAGQR